MRTLFMMTCFLPMFATAQIEDDFSDGNFNENPSWTGDTSHFKVISGQLQLQSAGNDTVALSTPCERFTSTEWSFWLKLAFNTSANNHARVYLLADSMSLHHALSGIYVQVGGSDDSIRVVRQTAVQPEPLYTFKSYRTFHSTNTLRFRLTRDGSGNWQAWVDTTGGKNWVHDGSFFDPSVITAAAFGIWCRFTTSNATRMYFDDFYVGPELHDTLPPVAEMAEAISAREIMVGYSENLAAGTAMNSTNYALLSDGRFPDSVFVDGSLPFTYRLIFGKSLPEGISDLLRITGMTDPDGNRMADTTLSVVFYQPRIHDIVIHEVLADPDPPIGLPASEYVELYNRSAYPVNLYNWVFRYGSYTKTFPRMVIPQGGFLLLSKDSMYLQYGSFFPLFTSATSLSNEGTVLILKNQDQQVIHVVEYSKDWFGGSFKEEGGWSLEMADPGNPCGGSENWRVCKDPSGGTPGRINSVFAENQDLTQPQLLRAAPADSGVIRIQLSESADSLTLSDTASWFILPGRKRPVSVEAVSPFYSEALLRFKDPFEKGTIYTLGLSGRVTDCAGNVADTGLHVKFALPDSILKGDVVINELLADPATGGVRFLELYNRSEKVVDLSTLVMSESQVAGELEAGACMLYPESLLLFPGEYAVFTPLPDDLISRYDTPFPAFLFRTGCFPALPDDSGTVVVASRSDFRMIDCFQYSASMHFPLLAEQSGVSLERIDPDRPAEDRSNWHSAAATAGFATPGYLNSQWFDSGDPGIGFTVQPQVFSPDNDGRDDVLTICYAPGEIGNLVHIRVFDAQGRVVKDLTGHTTISTHDCFSWDGTTVSNTLAPPGIYIVLLEWLNSNGAAGHLKKVAVLAPRI